MSRETPDQATSRMARDLAAGRNVSAEEAVAAIRRGLAGLDRLAETVLAMFRTLAAFHVALAIRDLYRDAWMLTGPRGR